ncbi:uncharacterized protein LOC142162309 [Nicotiana tabacum]|uniref:Uncharacterized protein LOC142162309 n=1 Tax=Nicotiana tabacum TaxID=4097 RepID=A0AC58RPW4_TOBAC
MGRKHCARRWWLRGQYHSSTQVAVESVASAMSVPCFSLFSDSQSLFSRNPSSSHVENTIENVELEGGKGNNINSSSVDETPYLSLPDTNSEPVIGGVPVTDKGKGKVVEDSELGEADVNPCLKQRLNHFALDGFVRDLVFSQLTVVERSMEGMRPCKLGVQNELFFIGGIVWMRSMDEKRWYCSISSLSNISYLVVQFDCWDFLVHMDLDYKPKVDWDTNCHVIHQLKANLSKRQLRLFKKTCFGYFLDLPQVIVQIRVMHHLLIREVHHEVKNEMRFVVNDSRLRFGLGEFALVTGLKCKGDTSIESITENRLISKYFGTASVTFAQLADCFKKKKWETDDDALKIAVLYFVNNFLLSQLKTKTWLYECCPSLDGHFADHLGNKLPRILNWVVMGQIPNERVAFKGVKQLKNITPTDDKKQLFDVRGLNFEIEVDCTDSQPDNLQVFGTQLPKTQSMHESTGGDSQPTNAEVMKELQALKLFVETKFEKVLAAIGRQSMKPEGNSADNDPDFREMHNDYDQFESGHVGNDPVVLGDSTPKAPSISDFGGIGQDGGATGVNVKNVTTRIPVQTRADVVIESNTAPQACRVDDVGQVDVGGSNVNLPSAPCRHGGDLHLDSDFEYTDSQLDLIDAITQGGRRNVNQSGNELTTRVVNKSKPDQSVSRSIVQIQTDVETTHAVFARRRRPAAVKQSPYRNDWQSGISAVGGSSKVIKGRFPFVNDISETVDFKLTTAFSNFVEANMQLGKVFTEFVKGGKQDHLIDRSDDIMEYMKGFRMHCNTSWYQVDHIIFPINLAEIWHWILGCVSFHKRCFYVYDSLRSRKHKKAIQKVAEAYAVLIPLFLVSIEFYNQRSDIVVENGLHMGNKFTDPFEIELITNLSTQQNSYCGVYVACFAEYIIEDLPIPVANFDVDGLRARFGILLWHYGRNKQLHGESSESEAPVTPKKTRGKKRKK